MAVLGDYENATSRLNLIQNLDDLRIAARLKSRTRWSLMKTALSVNGPPSPPRIPVLPSDAKRPGCSFLEQIPKQVRDDPEQRSQTGALNKIISGQAHWGDNLRLFRKRPIPSFRQSSWSESRCYCFMTSSKKNRFFALERITSSPRRTVTTLLLFQPLNTDLYPRSFEARILNRSTSG